MNVTVKSFHPAEHNVCFEEHSLPVGAGPVAFRVWHGAEIDDTYDDNPVITCGPHLAKAVRTKEREGREVAEADEFKREFLGE